jgi:hypothetical protein
VSLTITDDEDLGDICGLDSDESVGNEFGVCPRCGVPDGAYDNHVEQGGCNCSP